MLSSLTETKALFDYITSITDASVAAQIAERFNMDINKSYICGLFHDYGEHIFLYSKLNIY